MFITLLLYVCWFIIIECCRCKQLMYEAFFSSNVTKFICLLIDRCIKMLNYGRMAFISIFLSRCIFSSGFTVSSINFRVASCLRSEIVVVCVTIRFLYCVWLFGILLYWGEVRFEVRPLSCPFTLKMAFPSRISPLGSVWLILRDSQGDNFDLMCW